MRSKENGGTILYSAPEFAGLDKRSGTPQELFLGDIYGLGVLLYQLLTWRLPHDTLLQVVQHVPFPNPREINSSISPGLEQFILKALAYLPEHRWATVETMLCEFKTIKREQLNYNAIPQRSAAPKKNEDWSSQVIDLMTHKDYEKAASVAHFAFQNQKDPYAYLYQVKAKFRAELFYDCRRLFEEEWTLVISDHLIGADLRSMALSVYVITRDFEQANRVLKVALEKDRGSAGLKLQQASLYGMQARYEEAKDVLLELNRETPKQGPVLKRLAMVYEQLRETDTAVTFLKAYLNVVPHDNHAQQKLNQLVQFV